MEELLTSWVSMRGYGGSASAFDAAAAGEVPPEGDEPHAPDREERPVIRRNVRRQVAHVVEVEQVVVDQPLDQVEQAPPEQQLAGERLGARQRRPRARVAQQEVDPG